MPIQLGLTDLFFASSVNRFAFVSPTCLYLLSCGSFFFSSLLLCFCQVLSVFFSLAFPYCFSFPSVPITLAFPPLFNSFRQPISVFQSTFTLLQFFISPYFFRRHFNLFISILKIFLASRSRIHFFIYPLPFLVQISLTLFASSLFSSPCCLGWRWRGKPERGEGR